MPSPRSPWEPRFTWERDSISSRNDAGYRLAGLGSRATRSGAALDHLPRSDFPLTGRVAYLNSAGMGLIPRSVQEAHDGFAREVATSGSLAFFEHLKAIKDAPRAAAARLFNANPADISIVTSTSEAINQIAWWLRPRAGQNIVAIDTESPAVTLPWIRVAEETGAKVRLVRASPEPAALSIDRWRPSWMIGRPPYP